MSTESTATAAIAPAPAPAVTPPVPAGPAKLWQSIGPRQHLAVILTLSLLALFTFANSFSTGFALDNKFLILDDPRVKDTTAENLKLILTEDYWFPKAVSGLYRPVTTLTYWFNYAVLGNGDRPATYHTINFILHWVNACLIYFLVLVLMDNLWPAFFAAALFTVHPITTESVTNIIGRSDLLAAACVLGGFLCHAKAQALGHRPLLKPAPALGVALGALVVIAGAVWKLPALALSGWQTTAVLATLLVLGSAAGALATGWRALPWLLALQLLTLLGLFSKESAVVVLGAIVLYDLLWRRRIGQSGPLADLGANLGSFFARSYIVLVPVLGVFWHVRHLLFSRMRPPELPFVDNPLIIADFWAARLTAIKVIGKYFWLLLWPQTLSCDYSFDQIPVVAWTFHRWADWKAIIALAA
ncbi:DUF1736 domain-containing protein, partial [bacterium]|nr:DUF1736 domain-containing protein [bacterium]